MTPDRRPTAAELMTGRAKPASAPTPPPNRRKEEAAAVSPPPRPQSARAGTKPKNVRVTLNIPPDLYRQLRKWTDHAADEIGAPQVSQQDALRAMLTACTLDKSIGLVVIDLLRRDN